MAKVAEIVQEEIKIKAARRVPPGDNWKCIFNDANDTIEFSNLTDCLEYIHQKTGKTQFYMDAREGFVYIVDTEEKIIEPEPTKIWSLYGEE